MNRDLQIEKLKKARRTAATAGLLIALMSAAKIVVGKKMGSSALLADGIHSATDLIALGTSWIGLRIAERPPTQKFPYGFYRAETLAALFVSLLIMVMAAGIAVEGIQRFQGIGHLEDIFLGIVTAFISLAVVSFFFFWGKRVARETGSQSLAVSAEEMRVDMFSTILVVVTLFAARFQVPRIEGITTLIIAALILWVGGKNFWMALMSLMDATVDSELEQEVRRILEKMTGVKWVEKLRARKAGPFFFLDGHVHVAPSMDVSRTHFLSHEAQEKIRRQRPEVESVLLHIEPYVGTTRRVIIPVEGPNGLREPVCRQFSRAPFFLAVTLEKGEEKDSWVMENPFYKNKVHTGLAVFHELIEEKQIDVILVREIGEITYHMLRDHGLETFLISEDVSAGEALALYRKQELTVLHEPTRSSQRDDEKEP